MKKLIKRFTKEQYTPRQTWRLVKTTFAATVVVTIAVVYFAVPKVTEEATALMERINPPVYAENVQQVEVDEANPEKLEQYYQEELEALADKYEQAHKNAARTEAIERVEADLEKEKEALRAEELFL